MKKKYYFLPAFFLFIYPLYSSHTLQKVPITKTTLTSFFKKIKEEKKEEQEKVDCKQQKKARRKQQKKIRKKQKRDALGLSEHQETNLVLDVNNKALIIHISKALFDNHNWKHSFDKKKQVLTFSCENKQNWKGSLDIVFDSKNFTCNVTYKRGTKHWFTRQSNRLWSTYQHTNLQYAVNLKKYVIEEDTSNDRWKIILPFDFNTPSTRKDKHSTSYVKESTSIVQKNTSYIKQKISDCWTINDEGKQVTILLSMKGFKKEDVSIDFDPEKKGLLVHAEDYIQQLSFYLVDNNIEGGTNACIIKEKILYHNKCQKNLPYKLDFNQIKAFFDAEKHLLIITIVKKAN